MARRGKTLTYGDLKFRPLEKRGQVDGKSYWRCERYLGVIDGRPRRRTVWTGWARKDQLAAIAAEREASSELDAAADPPADSRIATEETLRSGTVKTLARAWLAERQADADLSTQTRRLDKAQVMRVVQFIGETRVPNVGPATVDALRRGLRREYAVSTTRVTLNTLGAIWRWAHARGLVTGPLELRPAMRALRHAERRGEDTGAREKPTPTEEQAWKLADTMAEIAPAWAALGYRLLFMTGARIGEVAALTWGDVDGEGGTIRLVGKTGPRQVHVDKRALEVVVGEKSEAAGDDDRVLWVTEETAKVHLRSFMKEACAKAEVPAMTPHALRRYAVQRYIRAGVLPSVAAQQLGHSVRTMLRYYEQVRADDQAAAAAVAGLGVRPEPVGGGDAREADTGEGAEVIAFPRAAGQS